MSATNERLKIINQMVLAVVFGIGLLLVIFALLFVPSKPDSQVLAIVGTLLTTLGTVVVMQQTHFFKSPDISYPPTGDPNDTTKTVNHPPADGSGSPGGTPAA